MKANVKFNQNEKTIENYSGQKDMYLIFPFAFGTNNFRFKKNNYWNIVDHLILRAIVNNDFGLEELVKFSGIKRQLLIQILIPFLKLGWIEFLQIDRTIKIKATDRGFVISKLKELPTPKKQFSTNRDFLVNLFDGQYLGLINNPNINYFNNFEVKDFIKDLKSEEYIFIDKWDSPYTLIDSDKLANAVTQAGEIFIDMKDPLDRNLGIKKFLIFNIKITQSKNVIVTLSSNHINPNNNLINIFHKDFEKFLRGNVIARLQRMPAYENLVKKDNILTEEELKISYISSPLAYNIDSNNLELVLGGNKHKEFFLEIISTCHSYLIIHSTFIRPSVLYSFLDKLLEAVQRGVKIIILWGKDDFDTPTIREQELRNLEELTEKFKELYNEYNEQIILHDIHTGSHAKFILWDTTDTHCTILGSCNWFFSEFNRYESSVLIKDNELTRHMLNVSASLATGAKLTTNYLSKELMYIANKINVIKSKPSKNSAIVKLLLKDQHLKFIQDAKQAKGRVTLLSDKIQKSVYRSIWDTLVPCNVKINAFYSTVDEKVFTHNEALALANDLKNINKNICLKAHTPPSGNKNHAKVLAWDKDHIVITSLNWMSSDASGMYKNNDIYHEMGIYIFYPKIEQNFFAHFFNKDYHI